MDIVCQELGRKAAPYRHRLDEQTKLLRIGGILVGDISLSYLILNVMPAFPRVHH